MIADILKLWIKGNNVENIVIVVRLHHYQRVSRSLWSTTWLSAWTFAFPV